MIVAFKNHSLPVFISIHHHEFEKRMPEKMMFLTNIFYLSFLNNSNGVFPSSSVASRLNSISYCCLAMIRNR